MSALPLRRWASLAGQPARPLAGGLINQTWRVGEPPLAALQRVNPIFDPVVHEDIEAVTRHLEAEGMATPLLLRTREDGLYHLDEEGRCWRALSWVPGVTWHKLERPDQAAAAGALVARWHQLTSSLDHRFRFTRPLAHDTLHHMEVLRAALARHGDHRLIDEVRPVAEQTLEAWDRWEGRLDLPRRVCHGDLKISNLRFDAEGRGVCLLDPDTMGMLPLDVELGDAWRSWCNPAREDDGEVAFSMPLFRASAQAYLRVRPLPVELLEALPAGVERICLELTARFAADALEESYFGWDPALADSRGAHNLLRARGQLALARSARSCRGEMESALGVG